MRACRIVMRAVGDNSVYSQSYAMARPVVISATSRKCAGFQSVKAATTSISRCARSTNTRSPVSRQAKAQNRQRRRNSRDTPSRRRPSRRRSRAGLARSPRALARIAATHLARSGSRRWRSASDCQSCCVASSRGWGGSAVVTLPGRCCVAQALSKGSSRAQRRRKWRRPGPGVSGMSGRKCSALAVGCFGTGRRP